MAEKMALDTGTCSLATAGPAIDLPCAPVMGHVIRPGIPGAHDQSWRTREGFSSELHRRKAVRARREEAKVAARRRMIQARRDAEIEQRRAEQARKEAEEEAKKRQAVRARPPV